MAEVVYGFCALTALVCAGMLLAHYRRNGYRLLLWSGLCFVFLTMSNVFLLLDRTLPTTDFSMWRTGTALIGMTILIYGLIFDRE